MATSLDILLRFGFYKGDGDEADNYMHHVMPGVFPGRGELAQGCVRLVCKGPLNMCPHKSIFSPCFPARTSTGAYLTFETMVEFICMNSYQKLPASWRKHWVIMFCQSSSQGLSLRLLALEEMGMSSVLHHSPCVPNRLSGSASLRCALGDSLLT